MADDDYVDDEGDEEEQGAYVYRPNDSLLIALGRQWGAAPWYVSSFLIHMVVLALMLLFAPEPRPPKAPPIEVVSEIIEEEPIEEEVIEEPEVVETTEVTEDVTVTTDVTVQEVVVDMVTVDEPTEVVDDVMFNPDDSADSTDVAVMGLMATRSGGGRSNGKFGTRRGKARNGLAGKAGMLPSMKALEDGLAWLARTQDAGGHWDCQRYGGKRTSNISVTALAQLAFLGAGHSALAGTYRKNVKASQSYLLNNVDANTGRIGEFRYEAGITLMAMAEAWAMTEDKKLAPVVQAQTDDAMKYQNYNGGWGYFTVPDAKAAHVDTSVSGWWMMGMKSAKVAGAKVTDDCWDRALQYFKNAVVNANGSYEGATMSCYELGGAGTPNMTAVGLTCLQFLGLSREDPLVKGQADYFLTNPNRMINEKYSGASPYYAWYYQALGIFQMGTKSEYWKSFGPNLQRVMLSIQVKDGPDKGSWPPQVPFMTTLGHFEDQVGRVGTTAVGCLILEVSFRYGDAHAKSLK